MPNNGENWENKGLTLGPGDLSSPSTSLAMQFLPSPDFSSSGMSLAMWFQTPLQEEKGVRK